MPLDVQRLSKAVFYATVVILIAYQIGYLFLMNPVMQGFEPDNYEYFNLVQLMWQQHALSVSNPYLVFPSSGFFENPGLFVLPYLAHSFIALQGIMVLMLYLLVFLVSKKILDNTTLPSQYHYLAYSIILLNPTLMQQTQLLEWRGTIFATLLQLLILYILALAFGQGNRKRMLGASVLATGLVAFGMWMWSGGIILLASLALIPLFLLMRRFKGDFDSYRIIAIACVMFGIALMFATSFFVAEFTGVLHVMSLAVNSVFQRAVNYNSPVFGQLACYNPLQIAELGCMTPAQGLVVGSEFIFLGLLAWLLLARGSMAYDKSKYQLLIIGMLFLSLADVPISMIYLRMVQMLAPFVAIAVGIGTLVLIFRLPASRGIVLIVLAGLLLSQMAGFVSTASSDYGIYLADNPPQLIGMANFTSAQYANSTLLTFMGWGDYMEYAGHVRSYSDTIQELNYSFTLKENTDFLLNSTPEACAYLASLHNGVDLILVSNTLGEYVTYANASADSVVRNPLSLEQCGYSVLRQDSGFYLLGRES